MSITYQAYYTEKIKVSSTETSSIYQEQLVKHCKTYCTWGIWKCCLKNEQKLPMYSQKQLLPLHLDSLYSSPIVFSSLHSNWVPLSALFPYSFIEPRFITKTKHTLTSFLGMYASSFMGLYQTLGLFIMYITISARVSPYEAVPLKGLTVSLFHWLICHKAFCESVSFSLAPGSCGLGFFIIINSNSVALLEFLCVKK